jgi:ribosomal protein L37AE/L43A
MERSSATPFASPHRTACPCVEIADTDILFECPHCAKSLAVERRAAGLRMACPDCGARIEVPDPLKEAGVGSAADQQVLQQLQQAIGVTPEENPGDELLAGELHLIRRSIQRIHQLIERTG